MKEGVRTGGILPVASTSGLDGTAAVSPASPATSGIGPHPSTSTHTPHEHSSSSPLHGCFLCLLSFLLSVVMSAKKAAATASSKTENSNSALSAVQRKSRAPQLKRARSVSMSVDLECPRRSLKNKNKSITTCQPSNVEPLPPAPTDKLVSHLRPRLKHVSLCEGAERFLAHSVTEADEESSSDPNFFHFQELPEDCQLKVFSFLSPRERGVAAQVCTEWQNLMRSSSLWTVVDLTTFPQCHTATHDCTRECYTTYRDRTKKYLQYLQTVRPALKRFSFCYDIGDCEDRWLDAIESLLKCCRLQELRCVRLNWRETPQKPIWTESHTWSTADYKQFQHRHRHRQRKFVNFFEKFTAAAPNITQLILPFDWCSRSLEALGRLGSLQSLVLEKYFVFQRLQQESLDQLLASCGSLRRLILEVWTPSAQGVQLYDVASEKLTYLDVSQCRGFYLRTVNLPSVTVFKVNRHPWNGPLVCGDSISIPCLYQVLSEGAPSLKQLNEHTLHPDWYLDTYPELETVLCAVCSCQKHKTSWSV